MTHKSVTGSTRGNPWLPTAFVWWPQYDIYRTGGISWTVPIIMYTRSLLDTVIYWGADAPTHWPLVTCHHINDGSASYRSYWVTYLCQIWGESRQNHRSYRAGITRCAKFRHFCRRPNYLEDMGQGRKSLRETYSLMLYSDHLRDIREESIRKNGGGLRADTARCKTHYMRDTQPWQWSVLPYIEINDSRLWAHQIGQDKMCHILVAFIWLRIYRSRSNVITLHR